MYTHILSYTRCFSFVSSLPRCSDVELMAAHADLDAEFFELFHLGLAHYLDADWLTAREYLVEAAALQVRVCREAGWKDCVCVC